MTGRAPPPERSDGEAARPPGLRERTARRTYGFGFWLGVGLLLAYVVAAITALVAFRGSLGELPRTLAWIPPYSPLGPSWAHPFGVLPGFGVDLSQAIWQATPWDLALVASILAIDAGTGCLLGAIAGLDEGGPVDLLITFLSDSLAAIPSALFVVIIFAGLTALAAGSEGMPLFVVVFGLILWPTTARTVRERARLVAHRPFVEAARASGASPGRILLRHIVPNSLGPVFAQMPLDIAPIFFVLAAFPWYYNCQAPGGPPSSPLGGGGYLVPSLPPFSPLPSAAFPEWGYLLGFGTCEGISEPGSFNHWWMYVFPLVAIIVFGIAVALVCDGLERSRGADH